MKTLADPAYRAEIVGRLRTLRRESVPRWGQMSAHQTICHLGDACRMAMGDTRVSDASGLLPRPLLKWAALYLPVRWPPGIPTSPEIDQRCGGTAPVDFAADAAALEALLERLVTRTNGAWPRHPVFGRMSRSTWLRWAYLHTDHHLRQFGA